MKSAESNSRAEKYQRAISGKEPVIESGSGYKLSLLNYLNYHNVNTDSKEIRRRAEKLGNVSHIDDHDLRQLGILAPVIDRLSESDRVRILSKLTPKTVESAVTQTQKKPQQVKITKLSDAAEGLENFYYQTLQSRPVAKFDVVKFIEDKVKTSKEVYDDVRYLVTLWINELEYINNPQEDTYKHISAKRVKLVSGTIVAPLYTAVSKIKAERKVERKPRVRKEKPASVLVKSLSYLKEFKPLELKSIDPKKIIGASQLWVYNVKYKKLTHYVASSGIGLTVKGTTLYGFDVDKSVSKVVRKPDTVLGEITKRKLAYHMKMMTTTATVPTGRFNEDVVLLEV